MPALPSGTVTFLFTDIEGSTRLLHELGPARYAEMLATHRRSLRDAFARHGGVEVDTQGDAFFVAFADAAEALAAAAEAQTALIGGRIKIRIGLHTGTAEVTGSGYVGSDVHLGARIAAAGHGGQVVLSGTTRAAVNGVALIDLGEHRLKDFADPVWIYQLGEDRFPPLKSISNTNLPRPASTLVGRENEVREIAALVRDGARLVTLTGPGGTGKTRLAIAAATELVGEFRNGTFWVDLSPLRERALVLPAIAAALGAPGSVGDHIGERQILLVLDNMEQVADAAVDITALLEGCPNLRVVTTSRERLAVAGEVAVEVPALDERAAVELFVARSGLTAYDRETIAELCRRLDDLPLAVELAAARTGVLSPAQILQRLGKRLDLLRAGRGAEARQQTLRSTIEWSHQLLTVDEQTLFAHSAVFRGGWTLDAAEVIVGADIDTLQSLVLKSLVRHIGERFVMLETIREFALERLEAEASSRVIHDAHAAYFELLALKSKGGVERLSKESLGLIAQEHANIRAALDWLEASRDVQRVFDLCSALTGFWNTHGHIDEGLARLARVLDMDDRPTLPRARALLAAGDLAFDRTDRDDTRRRALAALTIFEHAGDTRGSADATFLLGMSETERDWERARDHFIIAAESFHALAETRKELDVTRRLAWAYHELGDRRRAAEIREGDVVRARQIGDRFIEASNLGGLAAYAMRDGDAQKALALAREALAIRRQIGDDWGSMIDLRTLARAFARVGQADTAARLTGCADSLLDESGIDDPTWLVRGREEAIAQIRQSLSESEFEVAYAEGRKLTTDEATSLAIEDG